MKIILASSSPRRKQLLEQIGLEFDIITSDIEENIEKNENAGQLVERLALNKALDVAQRTQTRNLVIGADTVVCKEQEILGKPRDKQEAYEMLKALSGRTHKVMTGVAIVEAPNGKSLVMHEETSVKFRDLSDDEIKEYIATGEPMDKAGSYGVQGKGALFIEKIDGCYFNVVGLPLSKFCIMIKEFGIDCFCI